MFDKLNKFLEKKSDKKKIIVIYGPTACGKTGLSIKIAKKINSEIVSTDSRQIFKDLDIATGKITKEETNQIPHHMLDIIKINSSYSVGEFKKQAQEKLLDIFSRGKIPILCGGTGLYIDSLIYDFDIPKIPADIKLRSQLEDEAKKYGNEFVYNKLIKIDELYAKELHPNNIRYIIRAIEVKTLTGKSKKDFRTQKKLKYDTLFLTPYDGDRKLLYSKIDKRIKMMFEQGLIGEVKSLLKKGYKKDDFGMQTIGYKEVVNYLDGKISLDETIELIQKHNRNYAKKQLTWFRKYEI